ncbi:MAG: CHASE domain-containing protein, partial [Microthrixaceae bacterium]|nr:CHASE domain-containing protein [Microthrixaceae bacterium]
VAVFLIAALGIGLTAGVLVLNQQRAQRIADTQAVSAVERAAGSLTLSFERTEEIVTGLAGFVMSSEQVDRDEFDRYVDRFLAGHPEFRSVQLLDYVTEAERTAFEAKLSGVGITGITERHAGDAAVTAPDRDDYLVVWFDAPTFGPDGSAGTNILTTPELDETLDEMVESGDTGVPPSVALPGPGRGEFGVPVLQPIFDPDLEPTTADEREGALVGAASVVISYSELIADDLAAVSDKVDLALADPEVNGQEFLLATRDGETLEGTGAASGAPPVPQPTDTAVVQLGPRELLLSASPRQSAVDAIAAGPRGWIIMIGLVLTLAAVAAYVRWSRVRRLERFARALEEANERLAMSTAELQEVVGRDRLTGLPNRQSVHQMVEDAMASDPDRGVSVVIIDLDRFKELNDSMG